MVGQRIRVSTLMAGLMGNAKQDKTQYPIYLEVMEEEVASVYLGSHALYGEWTYAIRSTWCLCRPIDSLGRTRLFVLADMLTFGWPTPLNQPISLSALSQH
jgi:hypothetical protein